MADDTSDPSEKITIFYYFLRFDSRGLDEVTVQEYGPRTRRGDLAKRVNYAIETAKKRLRAGAQSGAQATIIFGANPVASVRGRKAKRYRNWIALASERLPE